MKTVFQILVIISTFLIPNACHQDQESDANQIHHTWEAINFISIESVAYPKNDNKPILLTFNSEGNYQLKLDVNQCSGTFNSGINNQIEIGSAICTEMCCDSKFSEKLVVMLSQVTSYNIEGKTLKLNIQQWGFIQLELVK